MTAGAETSDSERARLPATAAKRVRELLMGMRTPCRGFGADGRRLQRESSGLSESDGDSMVRAGG